MPTSPSTAGRLRGAPRSRSTRRRRIPATTVGIEGAAAVAGEESELTFNVQRDGKPVDVEPYLGADGHLVALREGDLAFLHVHPVRTGKRPERIRFDDRVPEPRALPPLPAVQGSWRGPYGRLHEGGGAMTETRGYTENKDAVLNRLRRVEGQVRGVEGMVTEDRYCIDVVTQITAIQAALDKVALELLEDHAKHCVIGAADGDKDAKTEEMMGAVKRLVRR